MANTKISALTSLAAGSWATDDVLPIVDTSATQTKKTSIADFDLRYVQESQFVSSLIVYVDKNRADSYVEDGTIIRPYKTIKAAFDAITDASSSKKYAILVAPGSYVEDNALVIKPFISLVGVSKEVVTVKRSNSTAVVVNAATTGSTRFFIQGITFVNAVTVDRTGATTGGCNVEFNNCTITSTFTFNGIGAGKDFLYINELRFNGAVVCNALTSSFMSSVVIGNATFGTTGGTNADGFGSMAYLDSEDCYFSNLILNVATSHDGYYQLLKTTNGTNITATSSGTGTMTISADAISLTQVRGNLTTTGSVTIDFFSRAHALGYAPNPSSNWAATAPDNVADALDRLATKVKALNGGVAIP